MKPDSIKKWLSYLTDVHIESMMSDYNEELQVLLKNGRYQLCTPHAIYSYADKYDNFRDCFTLLDLDSPPIADVLLLGFGLGSIPYMLEKTFSKKFSYTGVEIDDAVIYLASKYVLDELQSEIELIHADAQSFILQTHTRYDMICMDIFVDDKIPKVFLTESFLQQVAENITSKGFLLFNHLATTKEDIQHADQYFDDVFHKVFPNSIVLDVHRNKMMLSDLSRLKSSYSVLTV